MKESIDFLKGEEARGEKKIEKPRKKGDKETKKRDEEGRQRRKKID